MSDTGAAPTRTRPIALRDLTVTYERHPAVHHLSGEFPAGCLCAIVGPNGAGKSTLLKAIVGLQRISGGSIDVGGVARRDIAYLPQQAEIDRQFPITVLDLVLLGHYARRGLLGALDRTCRQRALAALATVGLAGFEARTIATLSVGQFQRVLFARVMVQDARLILLDEPFAAVDTQTTQDLLTLIGRWHGEGRSVIVVSHDLEMVRNRFPTALLMARERIAWGPTAEALSAENLLRARRMSEAWDDSAGRCDFDAAMPDAA